MEITPSSSTPRTTKVRAAKPAAPKASAPTKKSVATKPIATKTVAAKAVATKPKVAAAPRKRKPELATTPQAPASRDLTPMIATAAYYLAEQRQFVPGYEMADWLTAEQLIRGSMMTGK